MRIAVVIFYWIAAVLLFVLSLHAELERGQVLKKAPKAGQPAAVERHSGESAVHPRSRQG